MGNKVSLQDIAKAAGVSVCTVSLALRQNPAISAPTRRIVQEAASRLGYERDPVIGELMSYLRRTSRKKRSKIYVAWINHRNEEDYFSKNVWIRELLEGSRQKANDLGCELVEFWMGPYAKRMSGERLGKILSTRGIRGAIIAPFQELDHPWNILPLGPFAVISVGTFLFEQRVSSIDGDDHENIRQCCLHLHELGYKRIGFVSGATHFPRGGNLAISAWLEDQHQTPATPPLAPLLMNPKDERVFADWLSKNKPDAIIADIYQFEDWIRRAGFRVPADIGFASPIIFSGMHKPSPSGIHQNLAAIGGAAVEQVLSLIQQHQYGLLDPPRRILIEGYWVNGTTTVSPTKRIKHPLV